MLLSLGTLITLASIGQHSNRTRASTPPPDPLCLFTNPCKARPVIKIRGCNPCYLTEDKEYDDQGAECHDQKDGNLNGAVVTIGDVINTKKPGEYQFHYECRNSLGINAVDTRKIIVKGSAIGESTHQPTHLHSLTNLVDTGLNHYQRLPAAENRQSRAAPSSSSISGKHKRSEALEKNRQVIHKRSK